MKPNAVKMQARKADEAIAALGAQGSANLVPGDGSSDPAPGVVEEAGTQPAAPAAAPVSELRYSEGGENILNFPGDDGVPLSEVQPIEQPGATPAPAAPGEDWEQRYKVLQGKFNKEMPEARSEIAQLRATVSNMQTLIANLQVAQQPAAPQPAPAPAAAPVAAPEVAALSQRDIDEVGEDILSAAASYAYTKWGKTLIEQISGLRADMAALKTEIAGTKSTAMAAKTAVVQDARSRMFAALDKDVPSWRAVNNQDDFKAWLGEEDVMSGEARQALLLRAYERNDAPRVATFFKAFLSENAPAVTQPAPNTEAAPVPAAPAGNTAPVDASQHIAPGRGRAAPPAGARPKIVWTPADITQFYADVKAGKFKNREAERTSLEADIFAAQLEGRVTGLRPQV